MNDEQRYYEQFQAVLDDLQQFLQQKINQQMIFAMLQIKKAARRLKPIQISHISVREGQNRLSSSRKSQLSSQSISLSRCKQSHISYDIIKGSQSLNQIRRKGMDKIYTQTIINQAENDQQNNMNDIHQVSFNQDSIVKNQKVPRLVGFVSSEEISDIEPFGQEDSIYKRNRAHTTHNNTHNIQSNTHNQHNQHNNQHNTHGTHNLHNQHKNIINQYQRSIVQEDDDEDDQFEDIVLSRLDQIQAKVTEMLRQKKRANRPLSQLIAYKPQTKLSNISSGSQINNHRPPRVGDYYRPHQSNNKSTALLSHKNQQIHKSKNISTQQYQKKDPNGKLSSFVQRLNIPIRAKPYQKLKTQQNEYSRNPHKKSVQYSQKSIHNQHPNKMRYQTQPNQELVTKSLIKQKQTSSQLNYHNITMQNFPSTSNYRYIPLSKLNLSLQNKNQPIKRLKQKQIDIEMQTERHPSRNSQHQSSFNYSNYKQIDNKQYGQNQEQQWHHQQFYHIKPSHQNSHLNSAVRSIMDSKVRAYSEHPDFIETQEQAEMSFINNNNVYNEIRELRELTKKHGEQKRQPYLRKQSYQIKQNQQKTQRSKYQQSLRPNQQSFHQQVPNHTPLQSHVQYVRYIQQPQPIYINQHQQYIVRPRQYITSDYEGNKKEKSYRGDDALSIRNQSSQSSANFNPSAKFNLPYQRVMGNIAGKDYKERSVQYNTNTNNNNNKYYGQAQKSQY